MIKPNVNLQLSETLTVKDLQYQILGIELTIGDRIITPQDLIGLELPAGIDTTGGVVISGRAPIWLYGYLIHELHPTAWVACYDPRIGAVVVATHTRLVHIGQVIKITSLNSSIVTSQSTPKQPEKLCPAVMIVGPPDSGKSVFSHTLFQTLLQDHPDIYLQRAHWDGEGNYVLEMGTATEAEIEEFKARNRGQLSERFFPYQAQAINNLRKQKSLVIVDVGGMVQPEKLPLLEVCTHYLIISSQLEAVEKWHKFCGIDAQLKPTGVIHSTLQNMELVHRYNPYIEVTCGAWIRGKSCEIPLILQRKFKELIVDNG